MTAQAKPMHGMTKNFNLSSFLLCSLLYSMSVSAYVDPLFRDGFEAFACTASDNPQPNTGISAEPGSGGCAAGMVRVDNFCIDRFEAALTDAAGAAVSPYFNHDGMVAISAADAVPQGYISQVQASAACAAAGKRLCTDTEWLRACQGPAATTYPYGNAYVAGTCNDYRATNPIVSLVGSFDAAQLNNPCVNQQPQTLDRAGARPACVSAEGVFDLAGNLDEWTADPSGTFRGGDYVDDTLNGNGCLYTTTAHDVNYHDYSTGFRCCADAPAAPLIRSDGR